MRTLKYAILGLISRMPMTGYDITGEFNNNQLANFWYAKHSQVYPELGRLVDEGLLTCQVVIQVEKMEKKLYTITDAGRRELREWLLQEDPLPPTPKDVFRLRMYFSDFMSREEMKNHLHDHVKKHQDKRRYLADIMEQNYQGKAPALGTREYGDFLVLEGAILRETSYIQWLENALEREDAYDGRT